MSGSNSLMPMQGGGQGAAAPSPGLGQAGPNPAQQPPGIHPALADAHDQAVAQFGQTSKMVSQMDRVRKELTTLAKMGSAVMPEDVIQGAGKLVGGGADPMHLANLMADMPASGGDALASWVAQHAASTAQQEAQLTAMHEAARHSLGVSSVHKLAAQSLLPQAQTPAKNPQSQSLAMMPTQGSA